MGPYSAILIALGGIAFMICIFQLMILLRKRSAMIFLYGSVVSLVFFLYCIITILTIKSRPSLEILLPVLKTQMILLQVTSLAFIGVAYKILEVKNRWVILSAILVILIQVVAGFSFDERILLGDDPGLSLLVVGAGEGLLMISPGFTIWRLMIDLAVLTYLLYLFVFLSNGLYKFKITFLLQVATGALIVFILAVFDQLIDLGSVRFYYLLPFGLFVNYFIFTHIPFSRFMKEVFQHYELVDREKKWRMLVDHANVIVVILNRMGHVVYVNPFFLKLTGYKESEVMGKDWFEFFVPSDQYYDVQGAFIEILEFDFHPNYRNPILTKFHEKRMIDWYNVRLRDAYEQVTGSISIGIDISDDEMEKAELAQKLAEAQELIARHKNDGKIK